MAIKNIICRGIGFSPGSTVYIPTLGFSIGVTLHDPHASRVVRTDMINKVARQDIAAGRINTILQAAKVVKTE